MHKDGSDRVVETGREARQGYRDRPVAVVLGISLLLAVVVLGLVWAFYWR